MLSKIRRRKSRRKGDGAELMERNDAVQRFERRDVNKSKDCQASEYDVRQNSSWSFDQQRVAGDTAILSICSFATAQVYHR